MATNKEKKDNIYTEYADNVVKLYEDFMKNVEELNKLCKNPPSKIKKKNKNTSVDVVVEKKSKEQKNQERCEKIENMIKWTEWSVEVTQKSLEIPIKFVEFIVAVTGESIELINTMLEKGLDFLINWANNKIEELIKEINEKDKTKKTAKKIKRIIIKVIKAIKLTMLTVKVAVLKGQLFVYKCLKDILSDINCERISNNLNLILAGTLEVLKAIASIILIILKVIDTILKSLGLIGLSLDGGAMAFVFSVKAMANGIMAAKAKEANNDLSGFGIMNIIDTTIEETLIKPLKTVNDKNKVAYVAANVALATANSMVPDIVPISNTESLNLKELKKMVNTLLLSIFTPSEPMPKYERLSVINLRYLMWLQMYFEPAMKQSFGMPGMP